MTPSFRPLPPPDDEVLLELLQRLDDRPCAMSNRLDGFVAGTLLPVESDEILAHLRQCVVCESVLARLQSLGDQKVTAAPALLRRLAHRGRSVPLVGLLGECAAIVALREQVTSLLQRSSVDSHLPAVLIEGETGAGKSILARAMHKASARAGGSFIHFDCAAIPGDLAEVELFGHERGAFTDAREAKPGGFQQAHRGTLLLGEIGLISMSLQPKLLAAIEDRSVRRVGGTRSEPADAWVIAESSENLELAFRGGRLRADLYHRLATVTLRVPPLRERGSDILLLAQHFLERACREYQLPPKSLSNDARDALLGYRWPGNVRELENFIERTVLFSDSSIVTSQALPLRPHQPGASPLDIQPELADAERQRLLAAWRVARGSLSRAAALLGIPRNTLRYRLRKLLSDEQEPQ